jgi:hypothetical protein
MIALLALTLALVSPVPVTAGATQTPFAVGTSLNTGEPGHIWVSGNGVHLRDVPCFGVAPHELLTIAGVEVDISCLVNFNLDQAMLNGTDFGTVIFTTTDGSGSWEGRLAGTLSDGLAHNQFIAQGTGSLAGTMIRGTYVESAVDPETGVRTAILSGVVLEVPGN